MRRTQNASVLAAEKTEVKPEVKKKGIVQYELIEGTDAFLRDGRFKDQKISEIIKSVEGRDYLGEIWPICSVELQKVLRKHFSE